MADIIVGLLNETPLPGFVSKMVSLNTQQRSREEEFLLAAVRFVITNTSTICQREPLSCLLMMIRSRSFKLTNLLLSKIEKGSFSSALLVASKLGQTEIVKLLVARGKEEPSTNARTSSLDLI